MSSKTAPGSVFRRFETDKEFRARMSTGSRYVPDWIESRELDEYVWMYFKKQRRIIEVAL